jgi:hypothetical protein
VRPFLSKNLRKSTYNFWLTFIIVLCTLKNSVFLPSGHSCPKIFVSQQSTYDKYSKMCRVFQHKNQLWINLHLLMIFSLFDQILQFKTIVRLSPVRNSTSLSHFPRGKNTISSVHFYKAGVRPTRISKVVDGKWVRTLMLKINNHVPPDSNDVMKHRVCYLHRHNNWKFKLCQSVDKYW